MKKFYIFLSVAFCLFIVLIFQSSFCYASTSYQLDIDLSSMNGSGTLCLDVPDDTYKYVVVIYKPSESNKYSVYISDIPFYYSSERIGTSMRGNFYLVGNSEGNFYYYNYYSTSASSSNVYSVDGGSTSTYGYSTPVTDIVSNIYSNFTIYDDDTYSDVYTNSILSVNSHYTNVNFDKTMFEVINDISIGLNLETLFFQVQNSIPIIVLCVLFVIGFVLVLYLIKGVSKGKLRI